jgi:hypothetical protein
MTHDQACRRTSGFIDRIVNDRVTDDDRRHAPTCPSCGPVLSRAERFDEELRGTARRLVVEDLPRGILDPRLAENGSRIRGRALVPSVATGLVAIAIAIVAFRSGMQPPPSGAESQPPLQIEAPGGSFVTSPGSGAPESPLRRRSAVIRGLPDRGFSCAGEATPPPANPGAAPSPRQDVCTGPAEPGPYTASVVIWSSNGDDVVDLTINAGILGDDTPDARNTVAIELSALTRLPFQSDAAATEAASFVLYYVPDLAAASPAIGIDIEGVHVQLERRPNGAYVVGLREA